MISAKQLIEEANSNNAEKTNFVNNLIFIKKLIQLSATPRTKNIAKLNFAVWRKEYKKGVELTSCYSLL